MIDPTYEPVFFFLCGILPAPDDTRESVSGAAACAVRTRTRRLVKYICGPWLRLLFPFVSARLCLCSLPY
jgi:hypothetical protein